MVNFIAEINNLFWGLILIVLLVGTGIFYTVRLKFVQLKISSRCCTINW